MTHDVVVVTSDRDLGSSEPFPGLSGRTVTRGCATIHYVDVNDAGQWVRLIRVLSRDPYDLILFNSLWNRALGIWPAALSALGVFRGPGVLMPRGELEPGALALKGTKKRIGRPVFRSVYRRAICAVGSTSQSEAEIAARWFPAVPVLMTSNAPDRIDFGEPAAAIPQSARAIRRSHPPDQGSVAFAQGTTTGH